MLFFFIWFRMLVSWTVETPETATPWGFYGHQLINRKAVFTLPRDLLPFYKENIDYITEHAVDPDKRRYANPHEAVRHYIDLDHGGENRGKYLPLTWRQAVLSETTLKFAGDTVPIIECHKGDCSLASGIEFRDSTALFSLLYRNIKPWGYDEDASLPCHDLDTYFTGLKCDSAVAIMLKENLSQYGILPWYLLTMQQRLTSAFMKGDNRQILKISADIGHYIGDAHVPLHTSENYNGQLTGQVGIHAFWESRIPELFAEEQYDFLVGRAEYILDPEKYFWNIVLESHTYVQKVLISERYLKTVYPEDTRFCFDRRSDVVIRTQCKVYAKAYQDDLDGMVEDRMRKAIHAIGSAWYTAWVDSGQPTLHPASYQPDSLDILEQITLDDQYREGEIRGRDH